MRVTSDGRRLIITAGVFVLVGGACSDASTGPRQPDPATLKPATLEAVTPTMLTATVGGPVTPAPGVRVKDGNGRPLQGTVVTFVVSAGLGVLTNSSPQTDLDGVATVGSWTVGNTVSAYKVTARLTGQPDVVFTAIAEAGPAALLTRVSGFGQTGVVGTALSNPLRVRVADSFENPVAGVTVTFSVVSGGGTLARDTAVTNAEGIATSGVWTLGLEAGRQQVKARAAIREVEFAAEAYAVGTQVGPQSSMTGTIAFVSERDGNSEIYLMNADGTGVTRLTNNAARDVEPAWSPDGQRIAFASDRAGDMDIYVMDANGSNVVRRTTAGRFNSSPAWSPDGKKIAFSSLRDGQYGLYVMNVDGDWANQGHLGYDRGWNAYPAWSPDGGKIAFVSDWRAFDFLYDLYVMNADGTNIKAVLTGPFFTVDGHIFYFQPAWSPDGRKLAVVTCEYAWDNCYPRSSIAIANADGSELRIITPAGGFARPAWSPDGSAIAFSSQSCRACVGSIRYVTVDGGTSGLITSNGHSPSWRP